MPKVKTPTTFSEYFGLDPKQLVKLGVLDPTLAIDTKLFIDPLLFPHSVHPEIHENATMQYRRHFENVISFLSRSEEKEDVAWRTARHLLVFHEIKGTCLGYGAGSISGSAFGRELTEKILNVGKEIVDLGITDPDLFPSMALFESKIGPDRVSDMATNVVYEMLLQFNLRILKKLGLEGEEFDICGINGHLLPNPFQVKRTPIILVPRDILRKLPIAHDWDDVANAAAQAAALRDRINEHIGHIWAAKTKRDKDKLRAQALASRDAFQTLLDVIHGVPPRAYDLVGDPEGLVIWASLAQKYARKYPLNLVTRTDTLNLSRVYAVVMEIINRFRQLVERNGLNKELYKENRHPRHESTAQRLFFAIAYCYCRANNIEMSPEVDSGTGQVDFKFSTGFDQRVLVEIKLSTNSKLITGYTTQLEVYKASEETMRAVYLVIDVGNMGKKAEKLIAIRNEVTGHGDPLGDLVFIDAKLKKSASVRKK